MPIPWLENQIMFHPRTYISFPSIHPVVEVPNDVPPRNRYFQAPRILPCVQIKLRRFNGSRTAYICGENVFLQIPQKLKCAELCKNYCSDPEMVYSVWVCPRYSNDTLLCNFSKFHACLLFHIGDLLMANMLLIF